MGTDLFSGVNPKKIQGRLIEFISAKIPQAYAEIYGEITNEMRLLEIPNSTGRKQADKTAQLQAPATFHEKGRMIQEAEVRAQKAELRTVESSAQALKVNQATQTPV